MSKLTKNELREIFRREIENTELTKLSMISAETSNRYMKLLEFERAKDIFIYVSVKKEFDSRFIIEKALLLGKNVYVPRIVSKVSDGAKMDFVKIEKLSDLTQKTFGIPEPGRETFHRTALVYDFSIVTLISENVITKNDRKMNLIVSENRIIAPNEA